MGDGEGRGPRASHGGRQRSSRGPTHGYGRSGRPDWGLAAREVQKGGSARPRTGAGAFGECSCDRFAAAHPQWRAARWRQPRVTAASRAGRSLLGAWVAVSENRWGGPRANRSRRSVALSPEAVVVVRQHRRRQADARPPAPPTRTGTSCSPPASGPRSSPGTSGGIGSGWRPPQACPAFTSMIFVMLTRR